jgi:formylglycine-generating enzyme required for sulfatase activity
VTASEPRLQEFEFEVVSVDGCGAVIGRKTGRAQQYVEELARGVVLEMVAIPAGAFLMGSLKSQGYEDECPQHRVALAPFWMGKYPVTQEQWKAVMGKELRWRFPGVPRRPADRISWHDGVAFCQRLSKQTGCAYSLPSEAQWEYACRAGTTELANYNGLHRYLDEPEGIYRHVSTEVGSFPPNAFGLYDMHGNVFEWCADPWHENYVGAPTDGREWEAGGETSYRVARGGSWHEPPGVCRSALRIKFALGDGEDYMGLRVVALPEAPQRK